MECQRCWTRAQPEPRKRVTITDRVASNGLLVFLLRKLHDVKSCHSSVSPYRCTCTSCSAVWLISIPRVCVTEISSLRTSWWTRRRPSSNSVTLAGQCRLCACLNWLLQCPFLIFNPPVSNCIIVGSVLSCPSVLS